MIDEEAGDVRVCIHHAQRQEVVGSLLDPTDRAIRLAEGDGLLATLPASKRMLEKHPVGGFFRRDWGVVPPRRFERMIPARICPMILWCSPDAAHLHFAARLAYDPPQERRPRGTIRLTAAAFVVGALTSGLSAVGDRPVDLGTLDGIDADLGELVGRSWIVKGSAKLSVEGEGYIALALSGVAEGVRVVWSAVSQSVHGE